MFAYVSIELIASAIETEDKCASVIGMGRGDDVVVASLA